jgi:hypothetical protein
VPKKLGDLTQTWAKHAYVVRTSIPVKHMSYYCYKCKVLHIFGTNISSFFFTYVTIYFIFTKVSFKLETDQELLTMKAQRAIEQYKVHMVVANLLQVLFVYFHVLYAFLFLFDVVSNLYFQ